MALVVTGCEDCYESHKADGQPLGVDAVTDAIYGYWDALLGVQTEGQLDQCGVFMTHATTTFKEALDIFA